MSVDASPPVLPATGVAPDLTAPTGATKDYVAKLEVGKTYSAQVVKEVVLGEAREGVVISDKFYAQTVPAGVKNDQLVAVKVLELSPELKIEFIEQAGNADNPKVAATVNRQLELLDKQLASLVRNVQAARDAVNNNKLPEEILNWIHKQAQDPLILDLDKLKAQPNRLADALKSLSLSKLSSAKDWLTNLKNNNATQQANTQIKNDLLQLLERVAGKKLTVHADHAESSSAKSSSAKSSIKAEQLMAGLQRQAIAVSSPSADIKNFLLTLESRTPEALVRQAAQRLLEASKNQIGAPEKLQEPVLKLVKLFEQSTEPFSRDVIHAGKAEVVKVLATVHSASEQVGDAPLRSIKMLALSLSAYLNNMDLASSDSKQIVQAKSSAIADLAELSKSPEWASKPQLLEALKSLVERSSQSTAYQRQFIKFVSSQVVAGAELSQLSERFQEIINSSSIELIQQSLKTIKLELSSDSSVLGKEIIKFADQLLTSLEKALTLPLLERSVLVQKILQTATAPLLEFLDKLNRLSDSRSNLDIAAPTPELDKKLRVLLATVQNTLQEFEHSVEGLFNGAEQQSVGQHGKSAGILFKAIEKILPELKNDPSQVSQRVSASLEEFTTSWQQLLKKGSASIEFKELTHNLVKNLETALKSNAVTNSNGNVPEVAQLLEQVTVKKLESLLSKIFVQTTNVNQQTVPGQTTSDDLANLARWFTQLSSQSFPDNTQIGQTKTAQTNQPALVALAQVLNNLASMPHGNKLDTAIKSEFMAFIELIKQLQTEDVKADGGLTQLLTNTIQMFSSELEKAVHETPKRQQDLLLKIADRIRSQLSDTQFNPATKSQSDSILKALNGLETMMRGQDAIMQMAPLLRAAGDPVFVLFPMLLQGMLSKLELNHYPQSRGRTGSTDEQSGQKENKSGKQELKRTVLNLNLPRLGAISVDLLYSDVQVQCKFILEQGTAAERLSANLDLLQNALLKAGYQDVHCQAAPGKVKSQTELQLKLVRRPSVIA